MQNIGSIIIRIALGVIFAVHGLQKFQGGISNTAGFFESIGIPGFFAYVVALIELIGGILVIFGLGTRIVGTLLSFIMIVAIITVKLPVGFIATNGTGYEFDLALAAMALSLTFVGAGKYSIDQFIANKKVANQ